ncbi:phosphohydrolase, partial [Cellulophaga sp. 2_MG-2023]|nr:phosphohydrolase [Cellulophaga sp. 2_MG-2023]
DIMAAIKEWQHNNDFVLSTLSRMILHRDLLHIKMKKKPIATSKLKKEFSAFKEKYNLTDEETAYFVFSGEIKNTAYIQHTQPIKVLKENGKVTDVLKASDQLNSKTLSKTVTKYYACYPKL